VQLVNRISTVNCAPTHLLSGIDLLSGKRRNRSVSRSVKMSAWLAIKATVYEPSARDGGTFVSPCDYRCVGKTEEGSMNGLIYLVGLVVVVLAVLSFFGLR
jgi:hypothetical protein